MASLVLTLSPGRAAFPAAPLEGMLAGMLAGILSLVLPGAAQSAEASMPEGVLVLSANASVEAAQDWMSLTLSVAREGADANAVQVQLKQAVDAALAEARKRVKPGEVELRSGGFSVSPRYGNKGTVTGWQGSSEVVIEGRDMGAIAQLSGRITSMTIARVGYSLSKEVREKLEAEATAQAIGRFRTQAADYARQFGYASFSLREVNVNAEGAMSAPEPKMRMLAMSARASSDEALPVEAGKSSVSATVSGSIQLK
jgi:predicted secreted protein